MDDYRYKALQNLAEHVISLLQALQRKTTIYKR